MTILSNTFKARLILLASFLIAGCASLQQSVQKPDVSLAAAEIDISNFFAPRFIFDLKVVNTNPFKLPLERLDYNISVLGVEILTGASDEEISIPAFGETTIRLKADTSLRQLFDLVREIRTLDANSTVAYQADVTITPKGMLPKMRISKTDSMPVADFF